MKSLVFPMLLVFTTTAAADNVDTGESVKSAVYSFDIGSNVRWFGDTSAAIVTEGQLAGIRMTIGRSLTSATLAHRSLDIGLFARWAYGVVSGTMFNNLNTSMSQNTLGGGVRIDAPLTRWFSVIGQGELGMARTSLTVTRDEMMPVDDHHWAPYAAASIGGDLRILNGQRLRSSLGVDVGYLFAVPVELHALPGDRPAEDLSIATTFAGVGKLDTRGVTFSMSLRGAF